MNRRYLKITLTLWILVSSAAAPAAGQETDLRLEEVVVTATRTPLPPGAAPQDVAVVEAEDIKAAGGSLEQALERLPGVHLNRSGSGQMAVLPTIRGSQPGQVLILVNGHRLNSQQSGWFNLSDLPFRESLIERVEVLEGSSSALYGAEAMGGVINVITRDPVELPRVSATASYGTYETRTGELLFSGGWQGNGLTAGVSREVTDGHRPNSDAEENRLNIHASVNRENRALILTADFLDKELGSPGPESFPSPLARQSDDKAVLGLKYLCTPSDRVEITADLFYNDYRREYEDPDYDISSRHDTETLGAGVQGILDETALGRWLLGLEYIRDRIDSSDDGEHHLTRLGGFLHDEWSPDLFWTLFLGARYDHYSLFDDQISPRLAVVREIGEGISARASVSRGYRTPTFDDLFWNDPFASGNPDLDPESSWTYDLGASWEKERTSGKAEVFLRDVKDLINWQDEDGDWVYSPVNISRARIFGLYGAVETDIVSGLRAYLNYTYMHPEDLDEGRVIEGRTRHLLTTGLRFFTRCVDGDLTLEWVDRYPAANLEDESYTLLGLNLYKSFPVGRESVLSLAAGIANLLDESYQVIAGYPMPGREFNLEATLEF
jgi:outer membrane cobalamin receptor